MAVYLKKWQIKNCCWEYFYFIFLDAIVFLQTLGSYRIPAVIERRRKELLDKLNLLQGGGSLKEVPVIDPLATDSKKSNSTIKETENAPKDKAESSENSSASSSTVTSPNHVKPRRRDSAAVSSLVKDFETIHTSAKKEEENETPKRFVTLKRVTKPTDFPASAEDSTVEKDKEEEAQEEKNLKEKETKEEEKDKEDSTVEATLEVSDATKEHAASVISGEESNDEEEDEKKKKKKSKKGGFLKVKKKIRKRDKSPTPSRKQTSPSVAESPVQPDSDKKEEELDKPDEQAAEVVEELQEEEEGVRISGILGRLKKKMGLGKSAKQVNAKVCETTLMLGDKEELDLSKCTVETTDSGFDLTHPQHKSTIMFKVDGDAELKEKWVAAIREAIEKATPPEEEKRECNTIKCVLVLEILFSNLLCCSLIFNSGTALVKPQLCMNSLTL